MAMQTHLRTRGYVCREVFPQNRGFPATEDEWGQLAKATYLNSLRGRTIKCLLIGLPECNGQRVQWFVAHWGPKARLENPVFAALSSDFTARERRRCWIVAEVSDGCSF